MVLMDTILWWVAYDGSSTQFVRIATFRHQHIIGQEAILFDFRCPRRLSALQGYYNLKGLCSADRKKRKLAFEVLRQYYHARKDER